MASITGSPRIHGRQIDHRPAHTLAVLALGISLILGLLLTVAAPTARAMSLPIESQRSLPEMPTRIEVAADGTSYSTLPTERAIAIEPWGGGDPGGRIVPLPGAAEPFDIAVTSDGATAYVSRLSTDADPQGSVERVDLTTGAVTPIADIGSRPTELELTADDATLVIGQEGDSQLVLVSTATDEVRARVTLQAQPYALAIDGQMAYVGGYQVIQSVDLATAEITATSEAIGGTAASLAVVQGRVVTAVTSAPPNRARLVAHDPRSLAVVDSVGMQTVDPTALAQFSITASATRVYARWGRKWAFEEATYSTAVVPMSTTGFGTPEPLTSAPPIVRALATDRTGRFLVLGGFQTGNDLGLYGYATGDEIVPTVEATARIAKKKLRVTGVTTGFDAGATVTVHVRKGKKYVAQKKTTTVESDGTFTWQQSFRGKSARLYVVVGGSNDSVRTEVITVSRR